jgi:hypothetical protein
MNEAMFIGSPGWVLKPGSLLGMSGIKSRLRLTGDIMYLSSCKSFLLFCSTEVLRYLQSHSLRAGKTSRHISKPSYFTQTAKKSGSRANVDHNVFLRIQH